MNKHQLSTSVLISFSELAWIIVIVLIIAIVMQRDINDPTKYIKEIERLNKEINELKITISDLNNELEICKRDLVLCKIDNSKISKEISGLKGELKKVVILFDVSWSMKEDAIRWDNAVTTVDTWLKHLPFEEVALITFGNGVEVFPKEHSFLPISADEGQVNRNLISNYLNRIAKNGKRECTNTYLALKTAYARYKEADMIILFTDGKPQTSSFEAKNEEEKGRVMKAEGEHVNGEMEKIYKLIEKQNNNKRIPINVVGLGNYMGDDKYIGNDNDTENNLKKGLLYFLAKVARLSGGSLSGR